MSAPSSASKGKGCCVSGCTEARMQRNYCARHHNAAIGKSDRPVRLADLEPAVAALLDALRRGVDAIHAAQQAGANSGAAAAAATAAAAPAASSGSAGTAVPPPVNPYLQLLAPVTERLLDNIKSPSSIQPLQGSTLDIFSFSPMANTATTPAAAAAMGAIGSPARPLSAVNGTAREDSQGGAGGSGSMPPSPGDGAPYSGRDRGVAMSVATVPPPIIDIAVQFSKQKKKVPAGFELLEYSISGKYEADLNKSGNGKNVMLCFQRAESPEEQQQVAANQHTASANSRSSASVSNPASAPVPPPAPAPTATGLRPITSLSVIFRDASEEPPYGFVAIDRTTTGAEANLNHHSSASAQAAGRQVYLCVHRGEGAPLVDLGVIFHAYKESLPAGYHVLKHTPFGNRADLNAALNSQTQDAQQQIPLQLQQQQAVYICFRPNVTPVLQSYLALLADPTGTADAAARGHLLYARVLALLTALLYSSDQKMVLHSLECFMKIPVDSIPALLLNRFLACVCDAAPCFQTYFTTQAHTALLKFLVHAFKTFAPLLTMDSLAKILEVCFLTRHEDKQSESSEKIVHALIERIERCRPCKCQLDERNDGRHGPIAMNAVAGGEGHSKPAPSHGHHKNVASSSVGGSVVGSSASSALGVAPSPASSADGSASAAPVASTILCSKCQWNRALASAPPALFCRELAWQLGSHVSTAKEIEADVKTFQRHKGTGEGFRTDIGKITSQLFNIDAQYFAHLEKVEEATAAANATAGAGAGAGAGTSPLSRSSGGGRGSLINSLASLAVAESEGTPLTPSSAAAVAVPSSFALDEVLVGGGPAAGSGSGVRKVADKDRVFVANKEERFLCVATLVCAKFAGESVSFGLVKSEQMKRKTHALRLLFYILHHGVYFFRSTPGGQLLIRRFICPALMSVCVTDSSLLWRLLLQTVTVLYDQYRSFLMIELGAFFDHICLSLLESPLVSHDLKKDVMDVFHHVLSRTPEHLINIYYNYDNHSRHWNLYDRLNTALARITEGEQKSFVPMLLSASALASAAAASGARSGGAAAAAAAAAATSSTADQRALYIEQQDDALQRQALKLLVHNLHMMAQWVGVPGLKRSPLIPSEPLITDDDERDTAGVDAPASATAAAATAAAPTPSHAKHAHSHSHSDAAARMSRVHRASRIDTWSWRHDKQKADAKMLSEALKLARTEKLKNALQYLRIVDPAYSNPKNIAGFLFSQEGLDKAEVGDFLGSCGDKFMSDDDHDALRHAYLEHLDFTGLLFDQGLRLFLCDSGFRLPGEAQKIDRLLEAFCQAYCRDNPNVFRNSSSAFVVAFALVMLNTDLHDARLKAGTSSRQPMTEAQFISNLRGVDAGHNFDRTFLETLYRNIAASAIEWKEKLGTATATEEKAKENQSDLEKCEDEARAVRKTYELALRRALAFLKNWAAHDQGYNRTSNTHIVAAMFEASWYRIVSALTLRSDNYRLGDVELLHVCLEGLAYGSTVAIALGLPTERQAFSRQLAKITFLERNRDSIKSASMHLRIVNGEHLKQEWYRPFNLMCDKSPARACRVVFDIAHDIKQKINYERRQARLRAIESDFNGEIVLVDPNRSFVREGQLLKISNSNAQKRAVYTFMLFNDLLLYASEGINSKWKCHRVVHLSLCRIEDLRGIAHEGAHAFRIVSPQKSFIVSAASKEKKQQWIQAIVHHLEQVMIKRRKYIEEAKRAAGAGAGAATSAGAGAAAGAGPVSPPGDGDGGKEELLRRYSTFIGQSDIDLNRFSRQDPAVGSALGGALGSTDGQPTAAAIAVAAAAAAAAKAANHCKLCIRPWAMFRRKQKCRWCSDSVCNDCCSQKCLVPGGEKRLVSVCDACFGVIKGMVGDGVKLLSVSDT